MILSSLIFTSLSLRIQATCPYIFKWASIWLFYLLFWGYRLLIFILTCWVGLFSNGTYSICFPFWAYYIPPIPCLMSPSNMLQTPTVYARSLYYKMPAKVSSIRVCSLYCTAHKIIQLTLSSLLNMYTPLPGSVSSTYLQSLLFFQKAHRYGVWWSLW